VAEVDQPARIAALMPDGAGHQFVFYGDACSGVPGAPHEATFARTNRVVARLDPAPEFIVFPGDEIIGLTAGEAALRAQWRHWREVEMAWLDRRIPIFHTTSNHASYDAMSERVFADVLSHLPRNGPPDQQGLSYWVRRGDLLLVAVHTGWTGLGGEGHVETDWLRRTLRDHADARFKLVVGHHPVFPVNGFAGDSQREVAAEHGAAFWRILVEHGVMAYLCSHILAFDVQVHDGVLQLLSAGAGTAHRMPEDVEYLHCVQAALDARGLRCQVLDQDGRVRERLAWPPALLPSATWQPLPRGESAAPLTGAIDALADDPLLAWRFSGVADAGDDGRPQTLLAAWSPGPALAPLWIGLTGRTRRLTVTLAPQAGRSPHYWFGPELGPGGFDIQLALHAGMGPGGVMWRAGDDGAWSSLAGASAWGVERLHFPARWSVGHGKGGPDDGPFRGADLAVAARLP
jgi:hypothetical protein